MTTPGSHAQRGRNLETVALITGTGLFALLVLAELAIRLGLVPHPGAEIPRWLFVLAFTLAVGPKSAGRVSKGAIWNLLPGRKK